MLDRLDETVHPFEIALNPGDVRVTTKYNEEDFRIAIFGTIHEGGHALYEQNISKDLVGTTLVEGHQWGFMSHNRYFYENFIGRTYLFGRKIMIYLKSYNPGQFDNISLEKFYQAINEVNHL